MDVLKQFHQLRLPSLREGAAEPALGELETRFGEGVSLLIQMYQLFDGERMWGSWIPGFRICSLAEVTELMQMTSDSWEWLEDERNEPHPMRNFVPIISSNAKTSLGPLFDERSSLHGAVIEYSYEAGQFRVWSSSVDHFLEAFMSLSVQHIVAPESLEQAFSSHAFTADDKAFLSQWAAVEYPVKDAPYRSVDEV